MTIGLKPFTALCITFGHESKGYLIIAMGVKVNLDVLGKSYLFTLRTAGCKKNGNCQNKIDTFLQFFHSVKPSYGR
jgi:hypothetical protein